MSILRVTNTGRLNYHIKALNGLISKDDQGKYHLTERGQLAINLLQNFPEKVQAENVLFIKKRSLKVTAAALLILLGVFLIIFAFFRRSQGLLPRTMLFPIELYSRIQLYF